ncbi:ABC transporter ATP-binding protein [Martelella sp. AD-3]|uniref:oligopeptide/dipeptide ABC transporter ATP-binding protein n=1 Tax=Martelella sp. AD-3 TaxID=686597 RepID=UPI000467AA21|nr:ABC transporter ATP-binding protein [Martelella sp. AD-3]MAM12021.1 ABC transporter ATP-binding protein [Rhizobiaceae bacterium]
MSKKDHLLEIDELEVRYPAAGLFARLRGAEGFVTVLPGTSLAIERGTTVGLIGESGSGKTTLGRAVMGLAPISGGRIRLDRDTVTSRRDRLWPGMRRKTAFMFQDAVASLDPRMRLGLSVTEPLVVHRMLEGDRREKAIALLGLVGLSPDFADRYPHEISGGQARRVTVARALALEPELVVADEPTAGLDLSVQGELLNLLNDLQERLHVSFLLITHNLAVARHVTDRIAIMYLGRIIEEGPSETVFRAPAHPYTRALLAAKETVDVDRLISGEVPSLKQRPAGCEFRTRCPIARALCAKKAPRPQRLENGHSAACHFAATAQGSAPSPRDTLNPPESQTKEDNDHE